jgi:hypothetical protein
MGHEAAGTILLPAYDANGNVRAMLERSTGTLGACFEYDAFGQTLRAKRPLCCRLSRRLFPS